MAVTIKEIAEKSGVSRGTVDRVLNHRGNVREDTKELILKVADELGYKPNKAGKALAARKKNYNIGIILCSEGNDFFDEMYRGINQAMEDVADYGISVVMKSSKGYQVKRQLELMEELSRDCHLIILNAITDPRIEAKIDELLEEGIPVITINNDLENSSRICYVGSDGFKSGETAAGMMSFLTGGTGNVLIASGSRQVLGHNQRIWGFCSCVGKRHRGLKLVASIETEDDNEIACERTAATLKERADITAVYVASGAAPGVCKAIKEAKRDDIVVIACDYPESMHPLIESGQVKATICQQPYTQGRMAVEIAVDYLVGGIEPKQTIFNMKSEIKIYENTIDV